MPNDWINRAAKEASDELLDMGGYETSSPRTFVKDLAAIIRKHAPKGGATMNKLQQLLKRLKQHQENSSGGYIETIIILREMVEELVGLELERPRRSLNSTCSLCGANYWNYNTCQNCGTVRTTRQLERSK